MLKYMYEWGPQHFGGPERPPSSPPSVTALGASMTWLIDTIGVGGAMEIVIVIDGVGRVVICMARNTPSTPLVQKVGVH